MSQNEESPKSRDLEKPKPQITVGPYPNYGQGGFPV